MTEKRYYQRDFEELYYIIDSNVISEKEFDERVEYDGYTAFEDSMSGDEIVDLLNENEQLKKVLGAILLEVKQDITNTNQTGEIKVFINPNSFEMISEVLRKYGALKDWYE